jgi:hypothetical protein
MIDGTRYFIYMFISLWKILVFTGMAWGLSLYTGVLRETYSLFTDFKLSFNSHEYNVTEIRDVLFSGVTHTGDALEDRYVGTLFTQELVPGNGFSTSMVCLEGSMASAPLFVEPSDILSFSQPQSLSVYLSFYTCDILSPSQS